MNKKRNIPTAFISSTCNDLKQVRVNLKAFIEGNYGFNVVLSEFDSFPIEPCLGTFENCLNIVDNYADIFILIIGNRYGTITEQGKSITNLEYLHAKTKNIPIFIFINKQIYDILPIWRKNPTNDFSDVTDNVKLLEFVAEIYDESNEWVYTYDSSADIEQTLKNQFALIFADGLIYRKLIASPQYEILNYDLPFGAVRALTEKPYAWEYKFFAYILKDEFNKLKTAKFDLKYGIFDINFTTKSGTELLDYIEEKFNEISGIVQHINIIFNNAIKDAFGDEDVSSNLEMMLYVSKQLADIYKKLVNWSLYFKSIITDEVFSKLLDLLYKAPQSVLEELEQFVDKFYHSVTSIPNVDDGVDRNLNFKCELRINNINEIMKELKRLSLKFLGLC